MATIAYDAYLDKVLAAWTGKSLGGIVGAPYEAHKMKDNVAAERAWPAKIYPNDDLDIQVVWMEMMEETGPRFEREDLVKFWQRQCWYNFAEYGYFLYNAQRGIMPPYSGSFNNEFYRECMGCPIRSEIWGVVNPGNPHRAAKLARWDGELDHIKNSVDAERFWAATGALAFAALDVETALEGALDVIGHDNEIAEIYRFTRDLYKARGTDFDACWLRMLRRYGHRDCSKAEINFAFTVFALLAGGGDFKKTIILTLNCGWDCDCTAATAGALLGITYGTKCLPADWVSNMGDRLCCDVNVRNRESSLADFARDTAVIGAEADQASGNGFITDIPADISERVRRNIASRKPRLPFSVEVVYEGAPVLFADREARAKIAVTAQTGKALAGRIRLSVAGENIVLTGEADTAFETTGHFELDVGIKLKPGASVLYDKNLIYYSVEAGGETREGVFGFAGARPWTVYGPYYEAWDKDKSEVCKFNNPDCICHPVHLPGESRVMSHNFVSLRRAYLDENALALRELPEEDPFLLQAAADRLTSNEIAGYVGECAYYLARDIVSEKEESVEASFGSTVPLKVWIGGKEALRNENHTTWHVRDNPVMVTVGGKPLRIVVKLAANADLFEFSNSFVLRTIDKTRGVSYLCDSTGTVLKDFGNGGV